MKEISTENSYIGVDLHVHTPASSCYKGHKTDEEYLNILRKYKEKNISIIAITDHNTIKGYRKLLQIKADIEQKLLTISELAKDYPEIEKVLLKAKDDRQLFNDILILPGVEFEVKPGIHMIMVFDNSSDLNIIENILEQHGYPKENQGREDVAEISTIDVMDWLKIVSNYNAITIAAHVDRDKGVFKELSGKYRASILKSKFLNAIQFNSQSTKDTILSLLQQKDYKRDEPLAFIQSSDYHGGDDVVGKSITYVKVEDKTFKSLQNAIRNPNECVSPTERPEIVNIIRQFIDDPNTILLESFDKDNNCHLPKAAVSAVLNNGYGAVLIGVKPKHKNIVGISVNKAYNIECIKDVIKSIMPKYPAYDLNIQSFPFGENEVIVIVLYSSSNDLFYVADDCKFYCFESNDLQEMKPNQIMYNMEKKIIDKFAGYDKSKSNKIVEISNQISNLKNGVEQYKIALLIDKSSVKFSDIIEVDLIQPLAYVLDNIDLIGTSSGSVILTDSSPRLDYAHLRFLPLRTCQYDENFNDAKDYKGEFIIITPGGGSHILATDDNVKIIANDTSSQPLLVLKVNKVDTAKYPAKLLIAWLKSTLFIWYCKYVIGDISIHDPKTYNEIVTPNRAVIDSSDIIINIVDQITEAETLCIDGYNSDIAKDDKMKLITEHNMFIDKLVNDLDKVIYDCYGLSDEQVCLINTMIKSSAIYQSETQLDQQ